MSSTPGGPTAIAILGDKLAPGLGDRYLARTGYEAQQTPEAADPAASDNLFEPVPGDHGAHGRFDARAVPRSLQLWVAKHRGALTMTGLAAVGMALNRSARR